MGNTQACCGKDADGASHNYDIPGKLTGAQKGNHIGLRRGDKRNASQLDLNDLESKMNFDNVIPTSKYNTAQDEPLKPEN